MNSKLTTNIPLVHGPSDVSIFDKVRDWSMDALRSSLSQPDQTGPEIRVDVVETAEAFIVSAEIPGTEPSDIAVYVETNFVTIRVPRWQLTKVTRGSGAEPRVRKLALPEDIDEARSSGRYELGVLRLTLIKRQTAIATAKEPPRRTPADVRGQGVDKAEQQKAIDRLPNWVCQQRVTEVLAVTATLPVIGDVDEFATFVMEQVPDPIPARLSDPALREIDTDSLMAVAVFPSGAIRTVGTVQPGPANSVLLAPFDYWSLIDPEDDQLAVGDEVLRLKLSMLAVATEP